MNNTKAYSQLFTIMAAAVVKSLISAKYLRELLFVDDDAEAAAAVPRAVPGTSNTYFFKIDLDETSVITL